jgi:formylglycine-generating enzyme required for sulfatase activity
LGLLLGQLGDPRVVVDLRDHDNRDAWVEILADDYFVGDDRRPLRIDEPFHISRYPVTNSQFALFIHEKGYETRPWWSDDGWKWREENGVVQPVYWHDRKWNGLNQPVVGVSFWEAEAFCKWAGGSLPEEYKWEAAARGREELDYPWGPESTWQDGICDTHEAGLGVTSPVGMFTRSRSKATELEDMAGEGLTLKELRGRKYRCLISVR